MVRCLLLLALWVHSGVARGEAPLPLRQGFEPLFNGKDLDGWIGGSTHDPREISDQLQQKWNEAVPRHWKVVDGILVSDGQGPHLVTEKKYRDFELWVDWKLAPGGDSGIYLRDIPQVQIWDPANERDHQHGADKGSGGLWNNKQHERFPLHRADKPTGEWNRMFVQLVGRYVTVRLNDKLVVDRVVLENFFARDQPLFEEGRIHLQTHGSETQFRNLLVREIPRDESQRIVAGIEYSSGDE